MDTNLRDDMKIITLKEHCTASMAPYSLLYNRFHQTHLMLVYVMMPSVDACLYVMTQTVLHQHIVPTNGI